MNIKIGIFGGDSELRGDLIKALCKIHGNIDEDKTQSEPLMPWQIPDLNCGYEKQKQDNGWRGGSRGKGGKTKWPRRR